MKRHTPMMPMHTCLEVSINAVTHVATVTDPGCSAVANFDPGISGVTEELLEGFSLGYPLPSPMSTATSIVYAIPSGYPAAGITLSVYDVTGHLVRTLVSGSGAANADNVTWNGRNDRGLPVTSGIYFFQLDWNGKHVNRRIVLLR